VRAVNILYVAPRLPYPPAKGDKTRAFHQIAELAKEHRVHLVCAIDPKDDVAGLPALGRHCASVEAVRIGRGAIRARAAWALLRGNPRWAFSHVSRALTERVARKLSAERFDVVLGSWIASAECLRRVNGVPRVLDFVDVVSELWRMAAAFAGFPASGIYRLEARRLARYEAQTASDLDGSVVVSEAEARLLRRQRADLDVSVVGNGVDLEYFTPPPDGRPASASTPHVVFTGTMDYLPNVDAVTYFCRSVLPRVREAIPGVRFEVVGRDPTPAVRALARESRVTVTSAVPDIRDYLGRATVAVAPLRIGRGIQNKVIEAMAMGVPVVATDVALEGLSLTDEDGARRANDPDTLAREVVDLIQRPSWRRECSLRARRFVEVNHRWDVHGARLRSVLEAVAARPRGQRS
jgi:sugar transferase (PEP-CTERM/EpsH1 system associated)